MTRFFAWITCAMLLAGVALTQSTPPKPAFGMADLHVNSGTQNGRGGRFVPWIGNGRYELRNVTLLNLIAQAYGMDADKVVGGPTWLEWDTYDLNATVPDGTTAESSKPMLQALLADRFKLAVHNESRDLPAYILTAGKSPKLKQSDGSGDTGCQSHLGGPGVTAMPGGAFRLNLNAGPILNSWTCHNQTMEAFTTMLRNQVSQNGTISPVTDQTELKGGWDFEFKITLNLRGLTTDTKPETITIFDAVDKQLGLKLTPAKQSLPVLVVDKAEKPTPNPPGVEEKLAVQHPKEFDVADVKPSDPGGRGGRLQITRGGGVNSQNLVLRTYIMQAYGIDNNMLIVPAAMEAALMNRYDIIARPPAPSVPAQSDSGTPAPPGPVAASSPDDNDAAWLMMRKLLEDRFGLKMHKEMRTLTAWKLVAVKPKMKKADPSERTRTTEGVGADGKDPRTAMPSRSRLVMFQNVTMAQFADKLEGLSAYLQTPAIDATGLDGSYDFTVNFSPMGAIGGQGGGRGGDGPASPEDAGSAEPNGALTLFEAIEQQLGLKLVEDKRPLEVLVLDHVEAKPTDN